MRSRAICASSDARRKDALRTALRAATPGERHAILWPHLQVISCWTDANAAAPAAHVARLFPHARIQGKGLIATEGFISLPLAGHEGAALSVRSHFLEFAPATAGNEVSDARSVSGSRARSRAAVRGHRVHGRWALSLSTARRRRSRRPYQSVSVDSIRRTAGLRVRLVRRKAERGVRRLRPARDPRRLRRLAGVCDAGVRRHAFDSRVCSLYRHDRAG